MNATVRLLRWLGIGTRLGAGLNPTAGSGTLVRWLLPMMMLAGMTLPVVGQNQFRTEVNPDGTVTIYKGTCPSGALVIPNTIDGRKVTGIGSFPIGGFSGCTGLTSVTIPDSVTVIGDGAFSGCTGLTSITIPDSVTSIRGGPMITIGAFSHCTGLTNVIIGNGVISIGGRAFFGCTNLTQVTIPDGVISIGDLAFSDCPLNDPLFSKSRTMLVRYPPGTTGGYLIPDSVTRIGDYAFADCANLMSVTIPDSVIAIGNGAFRGTGLTNITIPHSVSSIWNDNGRYAGSWGGTFLDCSSLSDVTIGNGVTSIGDWAFSNCSRLTRITIPDSVTSIGDYAFRDCTGLTSITIPESVTSVGDAAFQGCSNLTAAFFEGDAPSWLALPDWQVAFSEPATIYYLPGTMGWGRNLGGCPKAPWVRPHPTILDFGDRFGPTTNGFGFVISWATNVPVVVEASADIGDQSWTPISTNTLTDGWVQFADPDWKSQPARFYRVRGQ